jgi:Lamin Tail Domain
MKKRYLHFGTCISIGLFAVPMTGWAQIVMTEVMYDVPGTDTGREWVEVRNDGATAVDLSAWKFFEANVAHKIAAVGSVNIAPGAFAVIADVPDKFLADNPGFAGQVFDSTFSLSGDGEALVLRDAGGSDVDSVSYDTTVGAKGDGMSLQKTADGRWVAATPTPGSANTATQSEVVANDSGDAAATDSGSDVTSTSSASSSTMGQSQDSQATLAHASQAIANTGADAVDFEVTSGRARLGFVDTPLEFRAKVRKGVSSTSTVEHAWSMGDGFVEYGAVIQHAYRFSGTYAVVLNSSSRDSRAVSRVVVRIVEPEISVVGATDQYVEIRNGSTLELNLGGWLIQTESERFFIGADTIVAPKGSLRFSFGAIPRFSPPHEFVRIVSPAGRVFAEWNFMDHFPGGDVMIELPRGVTRDLLEQIIRKSLESHE